MFNGIKKKLALLIVLTMSLTIFAGCAGKGKEEPADNQNNEQQNQDNNQSGEEQKRKGRYIECDALASRRCRSI